MQLGYVHAHRIFKANHAVKYVKPNYLGRIPKSRFPFPPSSPHHSPILRPPFPVPPFPVLPFPVLPFPVPPLPVPPLPVPPYPVTPFPVLPFLVPGFKDSRFQSISRFSTEKTIFLHVFNLQTLKTSLLLVFYSYSTRITRMYLCFTRMLLVCTRMYSYVTRMYSYVTRMYSCVTRIRGGSRIFRTLVKNFVAENWGRGYF